MRALDWSQTPLGPVESWPQSLQTAVGICLASRFPILLWWGAELTMLYNDGYRPMLGSTKHPRAMGHSGRECWSEIWDVIGPMLEGVLSDGKATWSDDLFLLVDRHGYSEECYFTFSFSPIRDETGGVGGVFTAVAETTGRVLGERRSRTARELAAVLVNARTSEQVLRQAARVFGANTADLPFTLLYRLEPSAPRAHLVAASGLRAGTALSPRHLSLADAAACWPLRHVAETVQPTLVTDLATRWDGIGVQAGPDLTPQSALVLPLTEPGQTRPTAVLVAGISPRLALDETYREFYDLLAGHVATALASANAHEAERRRAEALAELDRAKTTFFSNVSHEFRTPLTLMLGPLEDLLGAADLRPDQRDHLQMIYRNGLRLLKLVNTLLDFSRIEAGRAHAAYAPTDLAALTRDLASAFRSLIERAGLRLLVECPPLSEPVYVDREMWEKIVLNLLSNAFKFTFEGEIAVRLRKVRRQVELAVRDTGIGIAAAEVPRLFERFHRVQGARSRTHEGSGIGLALVQELVHLHCGTIRAESQLGVGTTFTICLPLGTAHLPADRIQPGHARASTALGVAPFVEEALRWLPGASADADGEERDKVGDWPLVANAAVSTSLVALAPAEEGAPTRSARILVADDNADLREYLTRLLSERYHVEAVADGAAALQAAHRCPPDLVLADVMMPALDGFELLRALRADLGLATLPVILLSARAGEEATLEGLAQGANDYLVKPFSAREVLARIATHLEIARLRQQADARAHALDNVNQELSASLSVVGHELRAPITTVVLQAELLKQRLATITAGGRSSPAALANARLRFEEGLEFIDGQTVRMERLVEDLLQAARIQTGRLDLRLEPCDLGPLVEQVVAERQLAWPERRLLLRMTADAEPMWVQADVQRTQQVVTNYLTNALKYAPSTSPIEIVVRRTEQQARVEVRDEGPGIPHDEQDHIWERFHRVPGAKVHGDAGGGLGLGLYLCKALIEGQGGQVGVQSLPGRGSTFWFTLPLADRASHVRNAAT
jgi:signal transduction histidine kinase